MHPSTVKVAAALHALGVAGQVTGLPAPAPTAASAAAQLGRPGRRCRTLRLCARW